MTTTPALPAYMPFKLDAAPMKFAGMDGVEDAPVPEARATEAAVLGTL